MSASSSSSLDGIWKLIRAEFEGEPAPELLTMKTKLELKDGNYIVRFDGQITDRGTFKAGDEAEQKIIILHGVEGPNAGRAVPGIYQLVGNRLRICYGMDGVAPTHFATSQQRYLATYQRVDSLC